MQDSEAVLHFANAANDPKALKPKALNVSTNNSNNPQLIRQWEAGVLAAQIQPEPQGLAQVKALTGQSATGRAPTWSTLAPHDEYLPPIRGGRAGKFQQLRLKTQLYLAPDK